MTGLYVYVLLKNARKSVTQVLPNLYLVEKTERYICIYCNIMLYERL